MAYKNVNIFKPELVNPEDVKLPIFVGERRLLVATPNDPDNSELYTNFRKNFNTFLDKIPSSPAKSAVKKLTERDLVFLGRDMSTSVKNGIIGSYIINKTRFAGVILDVVELDINIETGETSNIDLCFYTAYFEFLRAATTINSNRVKDDKQLHENLIKYMYYIYLRLIGVNVNLSDKQKDLLNILCSYFFYRFLIGLQHPMAKEIVTTKFPKTFQSDVDIFIERLKKYTAMKDIFKGLIDFNLTSESPSSLIIKCLTKYRPTIFYGLTSSLDYLIALSIISKYPVLLFKSAVVSSELQDKIELSLTPLINQVKFDTTALSVR